MKKLIIPQKIKAGDTIGVVSPCKAPKAGEFTESKTKHATDFLKSLGLNVKFGKHIGEKSLYGGAEINERGYDFPIMQIGELGHFAESYSFPLGAMAQIDTKSKKIIIQNM